MFLSIISLSIFSKQSGNSFQRWKNYNERFYAPKPFQLYSLTKNQNILGGEKISITIISEGSTPDSIFLSLTPTQISTSERDSATITLKTTRDINGFYQFQLPELFQDYEYKAIGNLLPQHLIQFLLPIDQNSRSLKFL